MDGKDLADFIGMMFLDIWNWIKSNPLESFSSGLGKVFSFFGGKK